jgi:hypothetical protein
MKLNYSYILVSIVFLVVIGFSLNCSCNRVSPYYKDNLFARQFPYEGFSEFNGEVTGNAAPVGGNTALVGGNASAQRVEGFEGLQSAPYTAEIPIDIYSEAVGSTKCAPNPYSNSKGYLCLDAAQKQLLMTRGGNSTGKDSQIG